MKNDFTPIIHEYDEEDMVADNRRVMTREELHAMNNTVEITEPIFEKEEERIEEYKPQEVESEEEVDVTYQSNSKEWKYPPISLLKKM